MQEITHEGLSKLTDGPIEMKDVVAAMENESNKMVALHKPGSQIKDSKGQIYEVQLNGNWKKITTQVTGNAL